MREQHLRHLPAAAIGLTACLTICLTSAIAPAQPPALITDINRNSVSPPSSPSEFTRAGNGVFFFAYTSATGGELFITLGLHEAPATTRLVKDIRPGTQGSKLRYPTAVGNTLFFVADDGVTGLELWRSDGTNAGTTLVKDIQPGSTSSFPSLLVALGNTLFFTADDGTNGVELWKSDGTAAGTVLVADIQPGAASGAPSELVAAGNHVFFGADDGSNGRELWKSDGTAAGTVMVKDIQAGSASGYPISTLAFGTSVVFKADDGQTGFEPWISDGTAAGTLLLKDIEPGTGTAYTEGMTAAGNTLYFFARYNELWRTDGTPQGTFLVTSGFGRGWMTTGFGALLIFSVQGNNVSSMWRSDGTVAGTFALAGTWPTHGITELRTIGSTVYFQGNVNGQSANLGSLWKTDGTVAGTVMVTRIRPGPGTLDGGPTEFTEAPNGRVVFGAEDGVHGREPWVTDGTAAGTKMLADLQFDPARTHSGNVRMMADLSGTALLLADDGSHGLELWRTDGTAAGTQLVKDIYPGPETSMALEFVRLGRQVFFSANDGTNGFELWVTDGTTAGTRLVKDLVPGPNGSYPEAFTVFRGELWFAAAGGLWRTDGTGQGTILVAGVVASQLKVFGEVLLFAGRDQTRGNELWISDGTTAGTQLLKDIDPVVTARGPLDSNPHEFTELNGVMYFLAQTSQYGGQDLWQTDGTTIGTTLACDVEPGTGSVPYGLTVAGPRLFFIAGSLVGGFRYLWVTDGSAAGTTRVSLRAIDPTQLFRLGNRVVFAARDPFQTELWISDGTDAGTQVVKDIHPTGSSYPRYITAIGTRHLWFQADDGTRGFELWVTDGTAAGTRLVADIDPRPLSGSSPNYSAGSSAPWSFMLAAGRMLFAADNGFLGQEAWTVFPGATAQPVGEGCAPVGRTPTLTATDPALGTTATVAGDHAPLGSIGVVLVAAQAPVPLPWLGCTLYVDPFALIALPPFMTGGARWSQPFPIPNDVGLTYGRAALQVLLVTAGPQPTMALTNGVYWTLGN